MSSKQISGSQCGCSILNFNLCVLSGFYAWIGLIDFEYCCQQKSFTLMLGDEMTVSCDISSSVKLPEKWLKYLPNMSTGISSA